MPMIDVIYPEGALKPAALKEVESRLWAIALRWEAIEATATAASVAWVYMDERPRQHISVGGKPLTQNIYRINLRLMAGFMEQARIDGVAAELTRVLLEADGTAGDGSGPRVFCIVEEIPNGTWSIDGKTWATVFTAETLGVEQKRIEAMKRAIAERPRIEVSATPL
jgi:phenylpyruvate tautomerase PptA (4-oxalocrotonate tautomerase family)